MLKYWLKINTIKYINVKLLKDKNKTESSEIVCKYKCISIEYGMVKYCNTAPPLKPIWRCFLSHWCTFEQFQNFSSVNICSSICKAPQESTISIFCKALSFYQERKHPGQLHNSSVKQPKQFKILFLYRRSCVTNREQKRRGLRSVFQDQEVNSLFFFETFYRCTVKQLFPQGLEFTEGPQKNC